MLEERFHQLGPERRIDFEAFEVDNSLKLAAYSRMQLSSLQVSMLACDAQSFVFSVGFNAFQ